MNITSWQFAALLFCVIRLIVVALSRRYRFHWPAVFALDFTAMVIVWFATDQAVAHPVLALGTVIFSAATSGFAVSAHKGVHALALLPLIAGQIAVTFAIFAGAAGVFTAPSCWPGEYVSYMNECDYN